MKSQSSATHFPLIQADLLTASPRREVVSDFLAQADAWRIQACAWLAGPEWPAHLSSRVAELLRKALGEEVVSAFETAQEWTNLYPGPYAGMRSAETDEAAACRRARSILRWRYAMVFYFTDACDMVGPLALEVHECTFVMAALLMPAEIPGAKLCSNCLQPLPSDSKHSHQCAVRTLYESAH